MNVKRKQMKFSRVSPVAADDMGYQVNQYHSQSDIEHPIAEYHGTRGQKLIPGVHQSRVLKGSPFENFATRGKSSKYKL